MRPGGVDKVVDIETKGISLAVHLYNRNILDWIKQIKKKDTYDEALGLKYKLDPRLIDILRKAMTVVYLQGVSGVRDEIAYQLETGKVAQFTESTRFAEDNFDFASSTYDEAIEFFRAKQVLSPAEFRRLESQLKAISFSVQGIEEDGLLEMIKDSIDVAMADGMDFRQWAKNVDEAFTAYGVTPLSSHHLETVYRTNLMSAFNIARHETMTDDPNTSGFMYQAILDDRVRDSHAAMHGFVAAKDDPIWGTWYPPNDYQCRCVCIPVTDYYMQKHGIEFDTKVSKDAEEGGVGEDFKRKPLSLAQYHSTILDKPVSIKIENEKKTSMITKDEILNTLKASQKYLDEYEYVGVRIDTRKFEIGDDLPQSYVWVNGEKTKDLLNGTSAIGVEENFIRQFEKNESSFGGYFGKHIYVIAGNGREWGEDLGEIILRNAKVIKIIK